MKISLFWNLDLIFVSFSAGPWKEKNALLSALFREVSWNHFYTQTQVKYLIFFFFLSSQKVLLQTWQSISPNEDSWSIQRQIGILQCGMNFEIFFSQIGFHLPFTFFQTTEDKKVMGEFWRNLFEFVRCLKIYAIFVPKLVNLKYTFEINKHLEGFFFCQKYIYCYFLEWWSLHKKIYIDRWRRG